LGNDYNKILKENIAGLLLPLTEKYLAQVRAAAIHIGPFA
jgi:hypothetical protein